MCSLPSRPLHASGPIAARLRWVEEIIKKRRIVMSLHVSCCPIMPASLAHCVSEQRTIRATLLFSARPSFKPTGRLNAVEFTYLIDLIAPRGPTYFIIREQWYTWNHLRTMHNVCYRSHQRHNPLFLTSMAPLHCPHETTCIVQRHHNSTGPCLIICQRPANFCKWLISRQCWKNSFDV